MQDDERVPGTRTEASSTTRETEQGAKRPASTEPGTRGKKKKYTRPVRVNPMLTSACEHSVLTRYTGGLESNRPTQDVGEQHPAPSTIEHTSTYTVTLRDCKNVQIGPSYQSQNDVRNIAQQGLTGSPREEKAASSQSTTFHLSTFNGGCEEIRRTSHMFVAYCRRKIQNSFAETTICNQARTHLLGEKTLLLIGGSGDGKTSILHYLSISLVDEYLPLPCTRVKEIRKYIDRVQGTSLRLLLLYDDPFGKSFTQQDLVNEWVHMVENLEMYLDQTMHKFVFATRKNVWTDCKEHLEESIVFCNVVEVTSGRLTREDKVAMVLIHLEEKAEHLAQVDVDDIVDDIKPIAFAQCCRLMSDAIARSNLTGKEITGIFQRPFSFIRSQLRQMAQMEKVQYATLCFIMLCGGHVRYEELTGALCDVTPSTKEIIQVTLDACGCKNETCGELLESAEKLNGTFLEKTLDESDKLRARNVYNFSHDSIHESVVMEYGKRHFRHCLKYLDRNVILKIARPYSYIESNEQEFILSIPEECYEKVAQVFTEKAAEGNWSLHDVFQNPCVREEHFLYCWIAYLKSSPKDIIALEQCTPWLGLCLMHLALRAGAHKIFDFLKEEGVECKCSESSPLSEAANVDQVEMVKRLITSQKPIADEVCKAVNSACESGCVKVLKLVLPKLKPEMYDKTIMRGLELASERGHREIVRFLVDNCYSPCKGDSCGCGCGMRAASRRGHIDIVEFLLVHGADVSATDAHGRTGLHTAASSGQIDTVRYLVSKGANVNAKDGMGLTSLHTAIIFKHANLVSDFISLGAEANVWNKCGVSALGQAAYDCDSTTVSILLSNGAETDKRDKWSQNALHLVMMKEDEPGERTDAVKALLESGADVNTRDKWGRTALCLVKHKGDKHVVDVFAEYGHDVNTEEDREWREPDESEKFEMFYNFCF